jgi:hypothetical protein
MDASAVIAPTASKVNVQISALSANLEKYAA